MSNEIAGAVLGTFAPVEGSVVADLNESDTEVSSSWQRLGQYAELAEVAGTLAGLPKGYLADMFGRGAAAGELLGLAVTAVRDAEAWRMLVPDETQAIRRTIAGRAMAEMSGLWSVSAAHAVTNVVARVVRIHAAASAMDKKLQWNGPPKPFDDSKSSHLSMNAPTVKAIAAAASATGEPGFTNFVCPLEELVSNPAWQALEHRRHVGYHRWRPQSVPGGASTTNPWVDDGKGHMSLSVRLSSRHVPPQLEELVPEARAGHTALSEAMSALIAALPGALDVCNVHVLTNGQP